MQSDDRRFSARREVLHDEPVRPALALLNTDFQAARPRQVALIDRPSLVFRRHATRGTGTPQENSAFPLVNEVNPKCPFLSRLIDERAKALKHRVFVLGYCLDY